jgi:bifunctional DNase/RNase
VSGAEPDKGWIEMQLKGLILDPTSDVPVVILRQEGSTVFLPIWIGVFEANAIALAVEGVQTPRPMTHDLLRSVLETLNVRLERVEIHSLIDGTFHARLRLLLAGGQSREGIGEGGRVESHVEVVDSRPSDAIALALRTGAPIWIAQGVLDGALASRQASELPSDDDERIRQWLENARPEDLGKYRM